MAKQKSGKAKDKRPARARYWRSGVLARRKIRNLMKCCRMTQEKASKLWHATRKRRKAVSSVA